MNINDFCILVVDDDIVDRQIVIRTLRKVHSPAKILEACDGPSTLTMLDQQSVDFIFIDYQLPGDNGLVVLNHIRNKGIDIPIVMLTGHGDEEVAVEVMKAGANDYYQKSNLTPAALEKIIRYARNTYNAQKKIHTIEQRIHFLAYHDILTELPNRSLLYDYLTEQMIQSAANGNSLAVLYFDIDQFKFINDIWGHSIGDQALREVTTRLHVALPQHFIARMGGDEFIVVVRNASLKLAKTLTQKIMDILEPVFVCNGYQFYITVSTGIACFPQDGNTPDIILRNADTAMYQAKALGKNTYHCYTTELGNNVAEYIALTSDLRQAIQRNEFVLYYQPKVDLQTKEIVGMEALVRWQSPEHGLVTPDKFIPLAEDTGMIVPLGEWVLQTACQQVCSWQELGLPSVPVAVNFSVKQIFHQGTLEMIKNILTKTGLPPSFLEIEITESIAIDNDKYLLTLLHELRKMGVKIALDDFGTGYSSLNYLLRFSLDELKIDKSFIAGITTNDTKSVLLITSIISIAQNLHLSVVAEGVETVEQLQFLQQHACDQFQGYLYSKPVPAKEFETLLAHQMKTL